MPHLAGPPRRPGDLEQKSAFCTIVPVGMHRSRFTLRARNMQLKQARNCGTNTTYLVGTTSNGTGPQTVGSPRRRGDLLQTLVVWEGDSLPSDNIISSLQKAHTRTAERSRLAILRPPHSRNPVAETISTHTCGYSAHRAFRLVEHSSQFTQSANLHRLLSLSRSLSLSACPSHTLSRATSKLPLMGAERPLKSETAQGVAGSRRMRPLVR